MQLRTLIGGWKLGRDRDSSQFIFRRNGHCVYQSSPFAKDVYEGKWRLRDSQHLIVQLRLPGLHGANGYLETTVFKFLVEQKDQLTVLPIEDPAGFAYDPQVWFRQR